MLKMLEYPLHLKGGAQTIAMPHEAVIRFVHEQGGRPTLWAEVSALHDLDLEETRTFHCFESGELVLRQLQYVGSVILTIQGGPTAWHIYEGEV